MIFMYDKEFGDWKLNTGLRAEYNLFNVNTADFSGQKVNVDRKYLDFLPSLNVSKTVDRIKKRFSISKTLARPEFREVANFAYYDFVRNAQLLGNSKLEKSDIYNIDLKWEYYPKTGETVSVGVFGKQFIKPIVLESFNNVSLDPKSNNFIARVIGNQTKTYDVTTNQMVIEGDYPNASNSSTRIN